MHTVSQFCRLLPSWSFGLYPCSRLSAFRHPEQFRPDQLFRPYSLGAVNQMAILDGKAESNLWREIYYGQQSAFGSLKEQG